MALRAADSSKDAFNGTAVRSLTLAVRCGSSTQNRDRQGAVAEGAPVLARVFNVAALASALLG